MALVKIAYTVYIVTEKWKQLSWLGPAVTEGRGDGDFPSTGNMSMALPWAIFTGNQRK